MASPNPGGRPRLPTGVRQILEDAAPDAARELVRLLKTSDSGNDRFHAAEAILNRLYGKPHQSTDVSVTETPKTDLVQSHLEELTEEQLVAALSATNAEP